MDTARGLSQVEAARGLIDAGPNELPSARPRTFRSLVLDVMREPMLLLLVATGVVYLALGDFHEALAVLAAIGLVVGLTVYQEYKTERTLDALRDLSSPRALISAAMFFATLVIANLALIFTNRSLTGTSLSRALRPNRGLTVLASAALLLLVAVLYTPQLQAVFRLSAPSPAQLAACFAAGTAVVGWVEVVKLIDLRTIHVVPGRRQEGIL